MTKRYFLYWASLALAFSLLLTSCDTGASSQTGGRFTYRMPVNPRTLNPYVGSEAEFAPIRYHIWQTLIHYDFKTLELVPVLAKARPTIKVLPDSSMTLDFELREEAKWDDGTPITAKDVEFSIKTMMCPLVANPQVKPYFEFITGMSIDPSNARKFSIHCARPYFRAESSLPDLWILPAQTYDSSGVLAKFPLEMFVDKAKAATLEANPDIQRFAEAFNGPKFQSEVLGGSGPYRFVKWETNQQLVFERKKDWWGAELEKENHWFMAYPDEIVYQIVLEAPSGIAGLKNGQLDAMRTIPARDFVEDLQKNEEFKKKFNLFSPGNFQYGGIGINMRNPKLSDLRVRQALASLVDKDRIINTAFYGMANKVSVPLSPSITKLYNSDVQGFPLDVEKAKQLLKEAGWADADGDGVVEKVLNGKKTMLRLDLIVVENSAASVAVSEVFQNDCKKAGIEINLVKIASSLLLERIRKHDFELYSGAWNTDPDGSDPKQIWHTESYNGGSNYFGFGDADSDRLIMAIRTETDPNKVISMSKTLQARIAADIPMIFIFNTKDRIAISNQFKDPIISSIFPGFWMNGLRK